MNIDGVVSEDTLRLARELKQRLMEENLLYNAPVLGLGTLEAWANASDLETWMDAYRK